MNFAEAMNAMMRVGIDYDAAGDALNKATKQGHAFIPMGAGKPGRTLVYSEGYALLYGGSEEWGTDV
jgi:hypothetical protein